MKFNIDHAIVIALKDKQYMTSDTIEHFNAQMVSVSIASHQHWGNFFDKMAMTHQYDCPSILFRITECSAKFDFVYCSNLLISTQYLKKYSVLLIFHYFHDKIGYNTVVKR